MSNNATLRWGICSAGRVANDFCCGLKLLPEDEHKIVAVAAREEDRAADFGEKFGIPKSYGDYDDLARDNDVGR